MKKFLLYIILSIIFISPAYARTMDAGPRPRWIEVDGDPTGRPNKIVTPTELLTFSGSTMSLDVLSGVSADRSYLRLDCSNDPLTGQLTIDVPSGIALSIDTLTTDNDKAINLILSADTDGDDVYGQYVTANVGTGTVSGDRKVYGNYVDLDVSATTAGAPNAPYGYAYYADIDVSGSWAYGYGFASTAVASGDGPVAGLPQALASLFYASATGINSRCYGGLFSVNVTGEDASGYAFQSSIITDNVASPTNDTHTAYGAYIRPFSYGTNDIIYCFLVDNQTMTGTHYGLVLDGDGTGSDVWWGEAQDSYMVFDSDSLNIVANAVTSTDDMEFTADTFLFTPESTTGGVTIDTPSGTALSIDTLSTNGDKVLDFTISSDTDGDTTQGIVGTINLGTTASSSSRLAFGTDFTITAAPTTATTATQYAYGHRVAATSTCEKAYLVGYQATTDTQYDDSDSVGYGSIFSALATGDNNIAYGGKFTAQALGTSSLAYGFHSAVQSGPSGGDANVHTSYGAYIQTTTLGANDLSYGLYVAPGTSTGNNYGAWFTSGNDYGIVLDGDGSAGGIYFGQGQDSTMWFDGLVFRVDPGTDNCAIGTTSLANLTSGVDNLTYGENALNDLTEATNCIGIGTDAGHKITTGTDNICIGVLAGEELATGRRNVLIGTEAGQEIESTGGKGDENVCIGFKAGHGTVGCDASRNVYIGYYAGFDSTTAVDNVAIGYSAGQDITEGHDNFFLGRSAGLLATTGNYMCALGSTAGAASNSGGSTFIGGLSGQYSAGATPTMVGGSAGQFQNGDRVVALGYKALRGTGVGRTGNDLVAVGYYSQYQHVEGNNNVSVGNYSMEDTTSGANNTALGHLAGNSISTGDGNVCLGYMAGDTNLTTADNKLYIANSNTATPLIYGEFDTPLVRLHSLLDVTGRVSMDSTLTVSDDIVGFGGISLGTNAPTPGFDGEGDVYATKNIKAMEGVFSEAAPYGTGLEVSDNSLATTYTNIPFADATLTAATQTITDTHASFDSTYVEQFLRVANSTPSFSGAVGEIIAVTSSTTLVVSFGTAGADTIVDATAMSFVIYPHPNFFVGDNGDIHASVGVNRDASFKVHVEESRNDHAIHGHVTAGVSGNAGMDMEYDADTYSGTSLYKARLDATGFVSPDTSATILDVIIDNQAPNAEGGEIHALDVAVADTTIVSIDVCAIGTHEGIDVICQELGDPAVIGAAYTVSGAVSTDVAYALSQDTAHATLFSSDNDYLYIGGTTTFDEINNILSTDSSAHILGTFEYTTENAATWESFSPSDDTSGYQNSGTIRFQSENLIGWDGATKSQAVVISADTTDYYWVRIQRTRNTIVTPPVEQTIKVTTHGSAFGWDREGALSIDSVAVTDAITEPGTVSGFAVIYVDTADGDLKVKFSDGTVTTIATD